MDTAQRVIRHLSALPELRYGIRSLVAVSLRLPGPQALSRQLRREKTRFRVLLIAEQKRRLYRALLENPKMSANELAYIAGLADATTLCYALKTWTNGAAGMKSIRKMSPDEIAAVLELDAIT